MYKLKYHSLIYIIFVCVFQAALKKKNKKKTALLLIFLFNLKVKKITSFMKISLNYEQGIFFFIEKTKSFLIYLFIIYTFLKHSTKLTLHSKFSQT